MGEKQAAFDAHDIQRKTKDSSDDRDVIIGTRLRARRNLMGWSQQVLGDKVGITFQQVQKYERGTNKISATRLMDFSKIFEVPVTYFYGAINNSNKIGVAAVSDTEQDDFEGDIMTRKETIRLIQAYYSIEDPKVRENVLKLVKSMAEADN